MRNLKFIFAASLFFAALSCEKVETPSTTPVSDSEDGLVMLTLSTGEATKTHLVNGTEIHWDSGDKIKIFTDENYFSSNAFSLKMPDTSPTPSGNFAKFSGEIASKSTKFWVVYPESKAVSCPKDGNGANLKVSIPSSQNPTVNSFANDLNVSVAKGVINEVDNGTLGIGGKYELVEPIHVNFRNVCALLKFTAPANASEITSVTISANEVIVGEMTIDYSGDEPKVTGVSGSKSITMTGSFEADKEYYFVVAPVSISGISMTIQANGETRYLAKNVNYALEPGVAKSLGSVDLTKMYKVTASAAHQTPKGVLSGTNITFEAKNAKNVADNPSVSLTVKKLEGNATRNVKVLSSAYTSDSAWPYLPQGAYTFSGSLTSNGVYVHIPSTSFTVPTLTKSQLTVAEFTPFTSYSKYQDKKPKEANSLDGSTIYVNVTHNISSNIIANTNYSQMITVEGNAPVYNADKTCVCFGGNDWMSHTISQITWTFDGVPVTKEITAKTVHVTGIPYDYSFDGGNYSGWTLNGGAYVDRPYGYTSKAVILQYREYAKGGLFGIGAKDEYKKGFIVSPKFYIPSNMYVVATVGRRAVHSNDKAINVYAGPVSNNNSTCASPVSASTAAGSSVPSVQTGDLPSFEMSPSSQYVSLDCESRKENVSRDIFSLHSVKIKYAK